MEDHIQIVECPRDAMQGIHDFIPTEMKIDYINKILEVGFDTVDFGSFVSPKAIPQMKDTAQVLDKLNLENTRSKLLCIVANRRGAVDACQHDKIHYLGYPFSISETFQMRNTNSNIDESFDRVKGILDMCTKNDKTLLIYISMGFGNPYGDEWNVEIVQEWIAKLADLGISHFQLSDTVGMAEPVSISYLFENIIPSNLGLEVGAHFHTTPFRWLEKLESAYEAGCRKFDGTISGIGGCPMAQNNLVGNMPSEHIITFANNKNIDHGLDLEKYSQAMKMARNIMM